LGHDDVDHIFHFPVEYVREAGDGGDDLIAPACTRVLHRGHRFCQTTRYDVPEVTQIRIYVQRETMGRDPAADVYADGGDLTPLGPDAGGAGFASGCDPKLPQRVYQDLFQGAHIGNHVALPFSQINDHIDHALAWPVIGSIASAIGAMEFDAGTFKQFRRGQQIFVMAVSSHRDDVRVLDNQQLIRNLFALPAFDELLLECERIGIAHAA
jgi:hypothetical protein